MQGAGNDFICVDARNNKVSTTMKEAMARRWCNRHFGIGADGMIWIEQDRNAHYAMDIYNADGSRALMCGNGLRCVAHYVYTYFWDNGRQLPENIKEGCTEESQTIQLSVDTRAGRKKIKYTPRPHSGGPIIEADMGAPVFLPGRIPILPWHPNQTHVINQSIYAGGRRYKITALSMGNPHCVVFMDGNRHKDYPKLGALLEGYWRFAGGVNVELVEVIDAQTISVYVWERGCGETLACGTGACAAVAGAVMNQRLEKGKPIMVKLKGGSLKVTWSNIDGHLYLEGTAAVVFKGQLPESGL